MRVVSLRNKLIIIVALAILSIWQINKFFTIYAESPNSKRNSENNQKSQKVQVAVYYEALCPDSRSFVITQLVPTFNTLEERIAVQMIPYGKADTIVTNDDYIFKCQHGETECEANIIHACTIEKIPDPKKHLPILACMIKNNIHPTSIFKNCAESTPEYEEILSCSKNMEGKKLLAKYGEKTKALHPKVTFIPTITLDHKSDNLVLILKNLLHQICKEFKVPPKECNEI